MSDHASAHTAAPSSSMVRETVDIVAPADAVFRALVVPHELAAWLGGDEPREMHEPTREPETAPDDHRPALAVELWPSFLARLAAHVAIVTTVARWSEPHAGSPEHWFDALHRAVVDIHHGD